MPLIIEISSVWLIAGVAALGYQRFRRRPWGEAAHLGAVFGIFVAIVYLLGLIIFRTIS